MWGVSSGEYSLETEGRNQKFPFIEGQKIRVTRHACGTRYWGVECKKPQQELLRLFRGPSVDFAVADEPSHSIGVILMHMPRQGKAAHTSGWMSERVHVITR